MSVTWDINRVLEAQGGNEKFVAHMVNGFMDTWEASANDLKEAIDSEDCVQITIKSHSIKSNLRFLEMNDLAKLAEKIETAAMLADLSAMTTDYENLVDAMRELTRQMQS